MPLLRGESEGLSDRERQKIFRYRLSYFATDLVVPTSNGTFMCDTEAGADNVVEILEFANSQLLELRDYDQLLDEDARSCSGRPHSAQGADAVCRRRVNVRRVNPLLTAPIRARHLHRVKCLWTHMRKHRILIVEDERDVAELIRHTLERLGEADTAIAGSGDVALKTVSEWKPDLVLLDLNLPVLDGSEVCRILRAGAATKHIPIVMLTARTGEDDRVRGLDLGADDYITKPFSLRELTARVRAVLRRQTADGKPESAGHVYRGSHLTVDFDAVSVTVGGKCIRLTRREFELLRYLIQNRNRLLARDQLLERVWGYDRVIETRSVDVHIGRLRKKLGDAGAQIETVVGLGYRFVDS